MSGRKKPAHLYWIDESSVFGMITADLLMSEPFQRLSHAARAFYIVLCVHKETSIQRSCLLAALREYYDGIGESMSSYDLEELAGAHGKRQCVDSTKFVIPSKQLVEYGYSPSYANKLKQELIRGGFIKVFANEKKHCGQLQGANRDFSKRVTIYAFCSDWKAKSSSQ